MRDLTATAHNAANSVAAQNRVVTRCISIADASLSLSLSLSWKGWLARPAAFGALWGAARRLLVAFDRGMRRGFRRSLSHTHVTRASVRACAGTWRGSVLAVVGDVPLVGFEFLGSGVRGGSWSLAY